MPPPLRWDAGERQRRRNEASRTGKGHVSDEEPPVSRASERSYWYDDRRRGDDDGDFEAAPMRRNRNSALPAGVPSHNGTSKRRPQAKPMTVERAKRLCDRRRSAGRVRRLRPTLTRPSPTLCRMGRVSCSAKERPMKAGIDARSRPRPFCARSAGAQASIAAQSASDGCMTMW
jgi:hypothetical protein